MRKPPKTEKSRVSERKQEDKYSTARSGRMEKDREDYKGKSYLKSGSGIVHDGNMRIDADVTKHGKGPAVPNGQWEKIANVTPQGIPDDPATAFDPMASKLRPRTHKKVNECDY
jgi:hypothetical protein